MKVSGLYFAAESKKAMSRSENYQNFITTTIGHAFDNNAVGRDNEDEQNKVSLEVNRSGTILSAIKKVGSIMFTLDSPLTLFYSFKRLSVPFNQALSTNSAS